MQRHGALLGRMRDHLVECRAAGGGEGAVDLCIELLAAIPDFPGIPPALADLTTLVADAIDSEPVSLLIILQRAARQI